MCASDVYRLSGGVRSKMNETGDRYDYWNNESMVSWEAAWLALVLFLLLFKMNVRGDVSCGGKVTRDVEMEGRGGGGDGWKE